MKFRLIVIAATCLAYILLERLNHYSQNYLLGTAVMALGDLVGTIIVIYMAKFLLLALGTKLGVR